MFVVQKSSAGFWFAEYQHAHKTNVLSEKYRFFNVDFYVQNVFSNISDDRQKICVSLLDEVCVKSVSQFHGGLIFWKVVNYPELLAIMSFMIVPLFGRKYLCRSLLVRNIAAKFLHDHASLINESIRRIGVKVVAFVCDGNLAKVIF